jgi:hypothetical protein
VAPKKPAAKKPVKPSLDTRIRTDAALRKRVLSNPGLRSKLSASSLQKYAPAQAKARALSVRLNAPITPGSSTTERDLAHEAQAATTVKYGTALSDAATNVGIGEQTQRDTGALYDQYRQALQQHQQNIALYQAGAQQALQNTQAGITGLGQQQATDMQAQANAGAAQRGVAQAGNLAPLADQALGVRQQLAGTFGAQQAMTGAAANTYADTQANVVAPGQKLTALNQQAGKVRDLRTKQQALKAEADAYNQTFRDTRRQNEFKNVLAQQTLVGNQAIAGAKAAASAAANDPATVAATAGARAAATNEAANAAKLGLSVHDYRLLGPKERGRRLKALKGTKAGSASDTRYSSGPFAGMLKSTVNALTPDAAQKLVDKYNKTKGDSTDPNSKTASTKAFRDKYGVDLQTTTAHNSGRDSAQNAQQAFKRVGSKVKQADGRVHIVTTDDIVNALRTGSSGANKTSPLWIRVGLELARGGITPGTAARLHKAGYSVAQLGLPMAKPKRRGAASGTTAAPAAGATTTSSQSR